MICKSGGKSGAKKSKEGPCVRKRPAAAASVTPSLEAPVKKPKTAAGSFKTTKVAGVPLGSSVQALKEAYPGVKKKETMYWRAFSIYHSKTLPGWRVKKSGERCDRTV